MAIRTGRRQRKGGRGVVGSAGSCDLTCSDRLGSSIIEADKGFDGIMIITRQSVTRLHSCRQRKGSDVPGSGEW